VVRANLILLFNMNLIFTLAVATSLTGVSTASSLRGVVETFEDQVAVALGGHQKQDCWQNCETWWGVGKESCQNCCQQGKDRSGDWTCDPTTLGGMCGATCHNDGQCRTGGLIMCGKCNTVGGTNYQNTCVADNTETPEPTPSPIEPMGKGCGGQQMPQCGSGQTGTRQMEAMCCPNDYGSFQYECVYLGESCPTPAPTPAPWEYPGGQGGRCAKGCSSNSDCRTGGFVMCGICNKVGGTRGVNTCINPPSDELDLE